MGSLVFELGCNEILSADIAVNLRNYISLRNPALSPASRAGIFADAINRIVEGRLPRFNDTVSKNLKNLLFKDITQKPLFSIDCADVFKSAVKTKTLGAEFFRELNCWVSEAINRTVAKESLFGLVVYARKLIDSIPGNNLDVYFESVERNIGGIRYIDLQQEFMAAETELTADILSGSGIELPGVIEESGDFGLLIPGVVRPDARKRSWLLDVIRNSILLLEPKILLTTSAAAVILSFMLFAGNPGSGAAEGNYTAKHDLIPVSAPSQPALYESTTQVKNTVEEKYVTIRMKATAYDLSYQSCGKLPDDPGYGITNSGARAMVGRTVAVDPQVIPLGTTLYITFPEEYANLDGYYVAEDTGRLIKGNSIDIFFGEDAEGSRVIHDRAMDFGIRYVDVKVLNQEDARTDE